MAELNECPGFENFGTDVRAGREAQKLSRSKLAEMVGISSRYLANLELGIAIPSVLVVLRLIHICHLPAEKYFNPGLIRGDSELRQRVGHKLQLCPERYLPIIEGALDRAIDMGKAEDA